ncbi:1-deoxy-D-xylulose-5-phosphate reductoisomerase [Kitasatospora sp. NPDC088264]|uniref:1-deoxy-D-xylulose-5-phosphate reductoisomerase n=1 Tax=unclassified Kitasatospora TaxID=2633591 RepID=UPI00342AFACA
MAVPGTHAPMAIADIHLPGDPPLGRRDVAVLGSTGSIGTQAVDVIRRNPDRLRAVALAAGTRNLPLLAQQALDLGVETVATSRREAAPALRLALKSQANGRRLPRVLAGPEAATQVAAIGCHRVLNGISGSIGLAPTLAALESGARLVLANKESLIAGGPLVRRLARPGQVIPVDSEHSALLQCLRGGQRREVRRLILTASGGPFRGYTRSRLDRVTVDQALAHPTWNMGPLVTVNSATLMNKGLEVIEAHLLFDVPLSRIAVVVHPQSVVHSMVEYADGSTLAQASPPDMRIPLALGLGWPDRIRDAAPACDWSTAATWEFFPLDTETFPAVSLARQAGDEGGLAPAVLNAANEECVRLFLTGRIPFTAIVDTVRRVLHATSRPVPSAALTLADVRKAETWARTQARELSTT